MKRTVAKRPWELLEQLVENGLEPDRYTCSTIVKGKGQQQGLKKGAIAKAV